MRIGDRYDLIQTYEGGMGVAHVCEDLATDGQLVVLKTYKEGDTDRKFRIQSLARHISFLGN